MVVCNDTPPVLLVRAQARFVHERIHYSNVYLAAESHRPAEVATRLRAQLLPMAEAVQVVRVARLCQQSMAEGLVATVDRHTAPRAARPQSP